MHGLLLLRRMRALSPSLSRYSAGGLLNVVAFLLLQCIDSMRTGFRSCSTWTQQLWPVGSRALAQ